MKALPIVERELRVAARRRMTYGSRLLGALTAIVVVLWMLWTFRSLAPASLGQQLFGTLVMFAFIYCLFSGTRTADCLSEEKREGTLGLLFLTNLKGHDVVIGKMAATSLNSIYTLLTILPVLAIPLLLGGVSAGQFWGTAAVLGNTLFLSLSVGIMVSALGREEKKVVGMTTALLLFIAGGLPLAGTVLHHTVIKPNWPELYASELVLHYFLLPSPGYALFAVAYRAPVISSPWESVGVVHFLGWIFLLSAIWILPRVWQDVPASSKKLRWRERWQQWCYGNGTVRRQFRTRLLERNPFLWLAGRDRLKRDFVWLFLGLCAVGWLWGWVKNANHWLDPANYIFTALVIHTVLRIWLANEAPVRLAEDRQSGALALLLCVPGGVRRLLWGQIQALQRQFLGPVAAVLAMDVLFFVLGWREVGGADRSMWILMCFGGMTMFLADLWTLSWVGMWLGLKKGRTTRASSNAIWLVLVLPWVILFLFMTLFGMSARHGWIDDTGFFWLWFALGLGLDGLLYFGARTRLENRIMEVAIEPVKVTK